MTATTELWRLHAQTNTVGHSYRTSAIGVRVAENARSSIDRLARHDVELGGLGFGPLPGYPDLLEVLWVSGPGDNAVCESGRYVPDLEFDLELADRVRERSDGAAGPIGEWHTHLVPGSIEPSASDLTAFRQSRLGFGLERWISLVIAPDAEGYWTLAKYVITGQHGDIDVCQRAR